MSVFATHKCIFRYCNPTSTGVGSFFLDLLLRCMSHIRIELSSDPETSHLVPLCSGTWEMVGTRQCWVLVCPLYCRFIYAFNCERLNRSTITNIISEEIIEKTRKEKLLFERLPHWFQLPLRAFCHWVSWSGYIVHWVWILQTKLDCCHLQGLISSSSH